MFIEETSKTLPENQPFAELDKIQETNLCALIRTLCRKPSNSAEVTVEEIANC